MSDAVTPPVFRDAMPGDEALVMRLVRELAAYERMADKCVATIEDFRIALFGPRPSCQALIVEHAGQPIGFALWHRAFSTFTGRPGLYVEDVFIEAGHRGQGIGRAVFAELARRGLAEDCAYMKWSVLDWNAQAVGFYNSLGAASMDEWTVRRLDGAGMAALAA